MRNTIITAGNIVRRPDSYLPITVLAVEPCAEDNCTRQAIHFRDPVSGIPAAAHAEDLLYVSARPLTAVPRPVRTGR